MREAGRAVFSRLGNEPPPEFAHRGVLVPQRGQKFALASWFAVNPHMHCVQYRTKWRFGLRGSLEFLVLIIFFLSVVEWKRPGALCPRPSVFEGIGPRFVPDVCRGSLLALSLFTPGDGLRGTRPSHGPP